MDLECANWSTCKNKAITIYAGFALCEECIYLAYEAGDLIRDTCQFSQFMDYCVEIGERIERFGEDPEHTSVNCQAVLDAMADGQENVVGSLDHIHKIRESHPKPENAVAP